jgi:tetratricopeptide (TPR) repeat protein
MPSYMFQSMGNDFGPSQIDHLQNKLAAGEFYPSHAVLADGRQSTVGDEVAANSVPADALRIFQSYLAVSEKRTSRDSFEEAMAYAKLGQVLMAESKIDEAIGHYRTALAIVEKLVAQDGARSRRPSITAWDADRSDVDRHILVAECNFGLALNGDDAARRYGVALQMLTPLARRLNDRQTAMLVKASMAMTELKRSSIEETIEQRFGFLEREVQSIRADVGRPREEGQPTLRRRVRTLEWRALILGEGLAAAIALLVIGVAYQAAPGLGIWLSIAATLAWAVTAFMIWRRCRP